MAAVAVEPVVAELAGRWEVQRAYDALRFPDGWTAVGPPVVQVPRRGSVLLSAVVKRPGDPAENLVAFVDVETRQGWRISGGAPDVSTAVLQMSDLTLGAAVLQGPGVVRIEVSRSVSTWW